MAGEMKELASTPLGQAILHGSIQDIRGLLRNGEDVLKTDRKGNTYLHLICSCHRPYKFHMLVAAGIDINAQNKSGNTPLHVTALQHETGHLSDLLMRGVNTHIRNNDGKTAAEIHTDNKYWHSIYEAFQPGFREAIDDHDMEQVEYLLRCWCAVDTSQDGKDIRQYAAAKRHHDIVGLIDRWRHYLMAIYGVLESDMKKVKEALTRTDLSVNFPQQIRNGYPRHILQHAIRMRNYRLVSTLVEAGADVNASAQIQDYIWGPVFFESICSVDETDRRILRKVIHNRANLLLKDQNGRNALTYAIDRTSGEVTTELCQYFLDNGIDVAARDDTGCSARNVALLRRRRDIVKLIDQHLVNLIRTAKLDELWRMARDGYEDFYIELKARDSWIYAAGNETDDVTQFLEHLPNFQNKVERLQQAIKKDDIDSVKDVFTMSSENETDLLKCCKDKAGRGPLILAVLWNRADIINYLMNAYPELMAQDVDNVGRTALHYEYALEAMPPSLEHALQEEYTELHNQVDCLQRKPCNYRGFVEESEDSWISRERKAEYGMEHLLSCLTQYEELLRVVYSKQKDMEKFTEILKTLRHPVAKLHRLFTPNGSPLVSNYQDLLVHAVANNKDDLARKLIRLGCDHWEKCEVDGGLQSAMELASQLNKGDLVDYMNRIEAIRQKIRK